MWKKPGTDKNQKQMHIKCEHTGKEKKRNPRKRADASNSSLNQNRNQPVNRPWMDKYGRSAKSSRTGWKFQESDQKGEIH